MASADEQEPACPRHARGREQLPRAYGVTDYDALLESRLRDAESARTLKRKWGGEKLTNAATLSLTHVLDTYTTRDGTDIHGNELVGRASVAMGAVHILLQSGNGGLLSRFLGRAIRQGDVRMARAAWCALVDSFDANDIGACIPWGDLRDGSKEQTGDLCTVVSVEMGACRPTYDEGEAAAIRNGACAGMLDLALQNRQWHPSTLRHACRLVLDRSAANGPIRDSGSEKRTVYRRLLDETMPPELRIESPTPSRVAPCSKHAPMLRQLLKALLRAAPGEVVFFHDDDPAFVEDAAEPPTGANVYQLPKWMHRGVHPELLAPLVEIEANRIALRGELADCPRTHVLCAHVLVSNAVSRPESWQPKQQIAMAVRLLEALMSPNVVEAVQTLLIEPVRSAEPFTDNWHRIKDQDEELCVRPRHHHLQNAMSESRPTPYVPLLLGVPLLAFGPEAWGGHLLPRVCELLPRILSSFEWPAWTLIAALDELLLSRVKGERVQAAIGQLVAELGQRSPSRGAQAQDHRLPLWFLQARLGSPTVLTTALHNNEGGAFDLLMQKVADWSGSALLEALTVAIAVDDVPHGLQLLEEEGRRLAGEPLPRIVRPWCKGEFCKHGPTTASSDETELARVGELPEGSGPDDAAYYHDGAAAWRMLHSFLGAGRVRSDLPDADRLRVERAVQRRANWSDMRHAFPGGDWHCSDDERGLLLKTLLRDNLLLPFAASRSPALFCAVLNHQPSVWLRDEKSFALLELLEADIVAHGVHPHRPCSVVGGAEAQRRAIAAIDDAIVTLLLAPHSLTEQDLPLDDCNLSFLPLARCRLRELTSMLFAPGGAGFRETMGRFAGMAKRQAPAEEGGGGSSSSDEKKRSRD